MWPVAPVTRRWVGAGEDILLGVGCWMVMGAMLGVVSRLRFVMMVLVIVARR